MKSIKNERGQTIVLFVLSIFAMVAMAALIIDGGNVYLKRRSAQTAADAAALAGVYEYCINEGNANDIDNVINQYATVENGASAVESWVLNADEEIEVEVSLTQYTFFAKILGRPTTTVTAQASAGCFVLALGRGILPLAWACKPEEGVFEWDSEDCKYKALDWEEELTPLINGVPSSVVIGGVTYSTPIDFNADLLPEIYIIMDSDSIPTGLDGTCESEGGNFICDIDGDGKDDFQGEGDIGWLDLDGGGGAMEESWFDGYDVELRIHMWIPSQTGVLANLFNKNGILHSKIGQIVSVPVFNQLCPPHFTQLDCEVDAHMNPPVSGVTDEWLEGSAGTSYYHLGGIGKFYITCVHGPGTGECPGHEAIVANNPGLGLENNSTLEGYFVTNIDAMDIIIGGDGLDLGNYIISLTP